MFTSQAQGQGPRRACGGSVGGGMFSDCSPSAASSAAGSAAAKPAVLHTDVAVSRWCATWTAGEQRAQGR